MMVKLKTENMTKVFGDLVAVNDLNLEILNGEFVCFVGPSGCGKTTTLNMLSGLEEPTRGNIVFDGKVINRLPARKRDIGMIFQDYAIFENMNVYENLAFSLVVKKRPKEEIDKVVKNVSKKLYLSDMLETKTILLTPGELQRVAIGRTVIMGPSVFLLDEPLNNLDADMRITMRGELKRLQKDLGKTMIYVTHDQEEAMSLADRIVVMQCGKVQQFDTPQMVYNRPVNKFVASFIGKLPMNFIDGHVKEEFGELLFIDRHKSFRLNISNLRQVIERKTFPVTELCLGIRPENILVVPSGEKDSFDAIASNVEFLGMENVVEFRLKGETETYYRMTVPPEVAPGVDETIPIRFQTEKIHLIDPATEKVLV
jgi:multiple sugar transport system ATP-binding protein